MDEYLKLVPRDYAAHLNQHYGFQIVVPEDPVKDDSPAT